MKNIINGHEYVDLGLPSGLKWATYNIGADKPEEYGDKFAWGEIEMKSSYDMDNNLTSGDAFNNEDVSGNLLYDAAATQWGAPWRMPTYEECKELVDKCNWEQMTRNGVKGILVTGPNGNSIFFPFAGSCFKTTLYGAGEYGECWSSTPTYFENGACRMTFLEQGAFVMNEERFYGNSIRPVF